MIVVDILSQHQRHEDLLRKLENLRVKYPEVHGPEPDLAHEETVFPADAPFKR
jgi:hypothetical protein